MWAMQCQANRIDSKNIYALGLPGANSSICQTQSKLAPLQQCNLTDLMLCMGNDPEG